jgi:hypothetical protein
MGWEIARDVEAAKLTMSAPARLSEKQIKTLILYVGAFIVLFLIAIWLAGNPFEFTQRIPSEFVKTKGWVGTNNWMIIWWVIVICAFFEYMDSVGGMGYGGAR